jgi:hypothetical protein
LGALILALIVPKECSAVSRLVRIASWVAASRSCTIVRRLARIGPPALDLGIEAQTADVVAWQPAISRSRSTFMAGRGGHLLCDLHREPGNRAHVVGLADQHDRLGRSCRTGSCRRFRLLERIASTQASVLRPDPGNLGHFLQDGCALPVGDLDALAGEAWRYE